MKRNWLNPTVVKFGLLSIIALLAFGCASHTRVAPAQPEVKATDDYLAYVLNTKRTYLENWGPGTNVVIITEPVQVKTKVTVASNGNVESSEIITPSGNPGFDQSVQETLDRVKTVQPFAAGAQDATRTFVIDFQLKPKSP